MSPLPAHAIQGMVVLLKVPAEIIHSVICTLVLLASVYLQKNGDQLVQGISSDH